LAYKLDGIAAKRPAQENPIARRNRLPLHRNFNNKNGITLDLHDLNARRDGWTCSSPYHRRNFMDSCSVAMASARAADTAVVFDTNEEMRHILTNTVCETDNGLDQIAIIERRALIALELEDERFARSDQRAQRIRCHRCISSGG
jgi:hypothetical protein